MSFLDKLNPSSGAYIGPEDKENTAEIMRVSKVIDINATAAAAVEAITIPLGALVTKVGFLATAGIASADFDIGDGDDTDFYMDGVTTLATNVLLTAPFPYAMNATSALIGENAGRYYAAADTIDVLVNATATTGSGRVIVWYTVGDTLGT